jgi:uncharacterized protein YggE
MKPFLGAALVSSLALASLAALPARAQDADAHGPHGSLLTLSAFGESHATPDMASINLGVVAQAPTAAEALRLNAEKMAALFAALKQAGVPDKDIQTSNLNLSPQYSFSGGSLGSAGPRKFVGYQVSNDVTVTVWDTGKLGSIADAAVAGGANQISGIGFGLRDPQAAEDAARLEAVRRVQAKAALYAKATGHTIKALRTLSEGGGVTERNFRGRGEQLLAGYVNATPTMVQSGELDLRVDVQATYELEP